MQASSSRLSDCDFPKSILLDTSAYCNLKCSMCPHKSMSRQKGKMSEPMAIKVIDEVAAVNPNVRLWMVFFGEAFINSNTFNLIRHAKNKGLTDVVLNTNGMMLTPRRRKAIIDSGLDAIYIGIDAYFTQTYRKLRVGGDFEKVKNQVLDLSIEANLSGHPKVYAQFVKTDDNESESGLFIDYWRNLNVKAKVRPKVTWCGDMPKSAFFNSEFDRWPCHWAMQTMSILWDGRVCTCACDYDGKSIFGNVLESSVKDIWASMKYIRLAHLERRWNMLPEFCQRCPDWQMARSETWE